MGWKIREDKLVQAKIECRQKNIDGLQLFFNGYVKKDLAAYGFTIHKNSAGQILDSIRQKIDTTKQYGGGLSVAYDYRQQFKVNDRLEITIGKKKTSC